MIWLLLACTKSEPGPQDTGTERVVVETGVQDTHDTHDTAERVAVELVVAPRDLVVQLGASVELRAAVQWSDGTWDRVSPTWESSGDAVQLTGAVANAAAVGTVELTARAEGLSASTGLQVVDDGRLSVTVLVQGDPVEGARVRVGDQRVVTGADGVAHLVVDAPTLDITVFHEPDQLPVSVFGVTTRALTVPLRQVADLDPAVAALAGTVDFSGAVQPAPDELGVGLVVPAWGGPLLAVTSTELLAPGRAVDFHGAELDVPSNLALQGYDETWGAPTQPGVATAWSLALPLPIAEVSAVAENPGSAFALLQEHHQDLRWASGHDTLRPSAALDQVVTVDAPDTLPIGFTGETPLLLVVAQDSGWLVQGLGTGGAVPHASSQDALWVLGWLEQGGVGSQGPGALAAAPVVDGHATLAPWLQPTAIGSVDAAGRRVQGTGDAAGGLAVAVVVSGDGSAREVWLPPGDVDLLLPDVPHLGLGLTTWTVRSFDAPALDYQQLLRDGAVHNAASVASAAGLHQTTIEGH